MALSKAIGIHIASSMSMAVAIVVMPAVTVMMVVVAAAGFGFIKHSLNVLRDRLFLDCSDSHGQRGNELENALRYLISRVLLQSHKITL